MSSEAEIADNDVSLSPSNHIPDAHSMPQVESEVSETGIVASSSAEDTEPKKQNGSHQKTIWMLTYCPAGTYITTEMLKKHGINADECHSTCDRVMNYTYIHLQKRCRIPAIEKFLTAARNDYGIVKKEVFGYDPISTKSIGPGSAKIQDHIVFKMLVTHSKEKNPSFSPSTDGEPILKRGPLFHAHETIEHMPIQLEKQSKTQVVNYARRLEEKLKNAEHNERELNSMTTMYIAATRERTNLYLDNDRLKYENEKLLQENANLKRKIEELER